MSNSSCLSDNKEAMAMIENENVEEEKNQSTVTVNTSSPTDTNSKILPPSSSSSISEGISANSSSNIATTLKQDELKGITVFYRCRFFFKSSK